MAYQDSSDILFDELAIWESSEGKRSLGGFSLNADCDCAGYTSIIDDDNDDTQAST
ncbi:hypothetical protein MUK70_19020 [Dyadobacter chenwenxiniae]|uniref:Uncharacterized protein n=1 Tax=Dyadobacter chenwenxiniae TaxID=2906456 RepID=A0A9X1TKL2_9BACT|nr:hypothetical protein [Dyadobacter chenwenxiniae]MCF0061333.1 hypothetical protein [Dyadobacter chenwenxiniae]UON81155.1 hypothetical protein MUK70_19020 [Dyadobacter chenwenxiniae]